MIVIGLGGGVGVEAQGPKKMDIGASRSADPSARQGPPLHPGDGGGRVGEGGKVVIISSSYIIIHFRQITTKLSE